MITVVDQAEADRDVPRLLALKAKLGIPWVGLSMEPLLGAVDLKNITPPGRSMDIMLPLAGLTWTVTSSGTRLTETHAKLDWVIVGGESGPGARPMHPDWGRSLRDQCQAAGVAFFFKQWGAWAPGLNDLDPTSIYVTALGEQVEEGDPGYAESEVMWRLGKKGAGRLLDGREWNEMPECKHV